MVLVGTGSPPRSDPCCARCRTGRTAPPSSLLPIYAGPSALAPLRRLSIDVNRILSLESSRHQHSSKRRRKQEPVIGTKHGGGSGSLHSLSF
jgi:hypothetical protein